MPLHTMIRNQSMGNLEWNNYVANISVEPISLIERGRWLPSVNEKEEGWAIVRKFREKTSWTRVETNCGVGKEHKSTSYRDVRAQTCECSPVSASTSTSTFLVQFLVFRRDGARTTSKFSCHPRPFLLSHL